MRLGFRLPLKAYEFPVSMDSLTPCCEGGLSQDVPPSRLSTGREETPETLRPEPPKP